MALDKWCQCFPMRPFFFVAPEDRGGQIHTGPASIWQFAEIMAITKRTREAVRSSAFACELRAADSPRPVAFISNLSQLGSGVVHGWPKLRQKGNFLEYIGPLSHSCSCGRQHTKLIGVGQERKFVTGMSPLFTVDFWTKVLVTASKTLRDGVKFPEESVQDSQSEEQTGLEYSGSPWFSSLSSSPDSQMDMYNVFIHPSLPAPGGTSSHLSASSIPSLEGSSSTGPLSVVCPGKGELSIHGWELGGGSGAGPGRAVSCSVGLGGGSLVASCEDRRGDGCGSVSGIGGGSAAVEDSAPKNRDHEVHAVSGTRGFELSERLSRFNGSGWISFSSQVDQLDEEKVEVPIEPESQEIDPGGPDHLVHGEAVDKTRSKFPVGGEVPMVVPTRAWVDEVKMLKQGDIYVGRGSKQRGLLPSFWANRYKVSKFGRDRAVELHRKEIQEDPQYGRRVHELSGKRLLCHCKPDEKCHAQNIQELFRDIFPHAYDPSGTARAPMASELDILAKAREDREESDESGLEDAEAQAPPGWSGTGKPMLIGSGYVERRLCDGQGLCSPGAWAPPDRRYPESPLWKELSRLFLSTAESVSSVQLLSELALGRHAKSPFEDSMVLKLRDNVKGVLKRGGIHVERVDGDRSDVPIDFRLLGGLLSAASDPEVSISAFAQGVRVGPGSRMPRCPRLYAKKRKWRIPEQREQVEVDELLATQGVWNKNYSTLLSFRKEVEEVLRDQANRGQVLIFSEAEARSRFPNLVVASLGAQKKEKPGGAVSARVLFDGTNGNFVNTSTHLRDQERAPVAPDLKRLMREKAKTGEVTFGLTADVKEAHRQVPIHPDDWHLLGCQLERGGEVFVNTVGTFGVSSASYYWSRVSAAVGRLTQYLISRYATTWIMLLADDYHVEVGGPHFRPALLVFFLLCEVLGCPLSWNKTNGGTVTNWVGFELLLREHALGLTERRAAWVVKWARETAAAKVIHLRAFEEALGRIVFATGALELLRPFLAPLYAFSTSAPRDSVRPVPAYVAFFLRFLAGAVERERHSKCAATLVQEERAPRVDAQASDDRTGVGGWLPAEGVDGRPDPSCSLWFSEEIKEEEFPWVFRREGKASRVIATLEALAMLLAVRAFFPNTQAAERTKLVVIPSYTDNRGNGALLNKLMSSKYPLSALLMEFSEQLRHSGVRPDVRWAPREANREADRLANGDTTGFDPALRLRVLPPVDGWFILDEALVLGETAESEKRKYQAEAGSRQQVKGKRKKPEDRLRLKDPW